MGGIWVYVLIYYTVVIFDGLPADIGESCILG